MYFRFKIDLPSFASFAGVHFCFSLPENERALFTLLPPKSFPLSPRGEKFDWEQIQIEIHRYTINRGKLYTTQRRTAFGSLKKPTTDKMAQDHNAAVFTWAHSRFPELKRAVSTQRCPLNLINYELQLALIRDHALTKRMLQRHHAPRTARHFSPTDETSTSQNNSDTLRRKSSAKNCPDWFTLVHE